MMRILKNRFLVGLCTLKENYRPNIIIINSVVLAIGDDELVNRDKFFYICIYVYNTYILHIYVYVFKGIW